MSTLRLHFTFIFLRRDPPPKKKEKKKKKKTSRSEVPGVRTSTHEEGEGAWTEAHNFTLALASLVLSSLLPHCLGYVNMGRTLTGHLIYIFYFIG